LRRFNFLAGGVAAAAVAVALATAPAGASSTYFQPSGGTPIGTAANCHGTIPFSVIGPAFPGDDNVGSPTDCAQAGYVATGRDFRFAQALIRVPDHPGNVRFDPQLYVALDAMTGNSQVPDFARVGIQPCNSGPFCSTSHWQAYTEVIDPTLNNPVFTFFSIPPAVEGDGVLVNVYSNRNNSDAFTIMLPSGANYAYNVAVTGPVYTRAEALADWAQPAADSHAKAPLTPFSKTRDTQFEQGRFTTSAGNQGTFRGPWTTTGVQATSNGSLAPSGTLIGDPAPLWTDSQSVHGLPGDAFGVWRYPF